MQIFIVHGFSQKMNTQKTEDYFSETKKKRNLDRAFHSNAAVSHAPFVHAQTLQ